MRAVVKNIPTPELREQVIAIVEESLRVLPGAHVDRVMLENALPQLRTSETYLRANAQVFIDAAKSYGIIPKVWYT
jgi:hypothetical protein